MRAAFLAAALVAAGAVPGASAPRSEETGGCAAFAWDLTRERALLADPGKPAVASGARRELGPPLALELELKPAESAALPHPPERTPRRPGTSAGFVVFPIAAAGLYRVTLSAGAWIDLVQDGALSKTEAFTGISDCPGARKSVRFRLVPGPATLQVSGVEGSRIALAVTPEP